jgi:hypothetical protein
MLFTETIATQGEGERKKMEHKKQKNRTYKRIRKEYSKREELNTHKAQLSLNN